MMALLHFFRSLLSLMFLGHFLCAACVAQDNGRVADLHEGYRSALKVLEDVRIVADQQITQNPDVIAQIPAERRPPMRTLSQIEYFRKGIKERRVRYVEGKIVLTEVYDGEMLLSYYPLNGQFDSEATAGRAQRTVGDPLFVSDEGSVPQLLTGGVDKAGAVFLAKDAHVVREEQRDGVAAVRLAGTLDINGTTVSATAWVSPERGGLLIGAELKDESGELLWDWRTAEYTRTSSGKWFPSLVIARTYARLGSKRVESTVNKTTVLALTSHPEVDEIALFSTSESAVPPSYLLQDIISGRNYIIGDDQ